MNSVIRKHSKGFKKITFLIAFGHPLKYNNPNGINIHELDFTFDDSIGIEYYQLYLEVKDSVLFHRVGENIHCRISDLDFNIPFPLGILELKETFLEEQYKSIGIAGKNVVDIGAFIGDTAIYFAKQKAAHVYAYEPAPVNFKIATENVKLNHLTSTITLRNQAIASVPKLLTFNYLPEFPGGSTSYFEGFNIKVKTFQVQGVTLEQILSEVGQVGLLKIDCEGAEHIVIPAACKRHLLKNVQNIVMEIHGPRKKLIKLLQEEGYTVKLITKSPRGGLSLISATRLSSS